ncbi:hypothetical protein Tco_1071175 [Tanacetum coccineum]|uniref:Uncharacterized protein n=1 Tax=Tanacetum coccineum TaxID=301880 RepID=A0ABQ5HNQ9_9ASTR
MHPDSACTATMAWWLSHDGVVVVARVIVVVVITTSAPLGVINTKRRNLNLLNPIQTHPAGVLNPKPKRTFMLLICNDPNHTPLLVFIAHIETHLEVVLPTKTKHTLYSGGVRLWMWLGCGSLWWWIINGGDGVVADKVATRVRSDVVCVGLKYDDDEWLWGGCGVAVWGVDGGHGGDVGEGRLVTR